MVNIKVPFIYSIILTLKRQKSVPNIVAGIGDTIVNETGIVPTHKISINI